MAGLWRPLRRFWATAWLATGLTEAAAVVCSELYIGWPTDHPQRDAPSHRTLAGIPTYRLVDMAFEYTYRTQCTSSWLRHNAVTTVLASTHY
jgi:hypothetical protein